MKYLPLLLLSLGLVGCHHSEFDVSADQISKHSTATGGPPMGGPLDFKHLPPGAVKGHEMHFKKGDRLPDGQIAQKDMTVFFQVPLPGGDGGAKGPTGGPAGAEKRVINGGGNSAFGYGPGPGK